jgi:hypothetical protein
MRDNVAHDPDTNTRPRRLCSHTKNVGPPSRRAGWRLCYNYLSQRPPAQPKPGTPEWFEEEEEEMLDREVDRFQREAMDLQELEECGMGPLLHLVR